MPMHPLFAQIVAPFAPSVDHEAYGRCPRGHVLGRYDESEWCPACEEDLIRSHGVDPRSHRVTVLDAEGNEVEDPKAQAQVGR